MWQYQNTDELYHYGILGMKWGHRKSISNFLEKQANKNVNRSNKLSRKLNKHGIGGENGYTPEFAKRRNAQMMTKGLQDGKLKKIPKGYQKVGDKILTDKQAYRQKFKENYKQIKKNSTIKDKLLYNDATRRYAAKQMTKNNMSEKDAVKKSKKVAWRNAAIIAGGALAAYGTTKLIKARNDKLYDKGLSAIKKIMSDESETQYKRLARELSTAKPGASGNIKGKFGGIAYKVGADGRSSIKSYLNYKNMHLGQLDDKDIRSIGKNVKNIRKYLR